MTESHSVLANPIPMRTRSQTKLHQTSLSPLPTAAAAGISQNDSSSSSKISFRHRKIRKLTTAKPPQPPPSATATTVKIIKPLSSEGEIDLALRHLTAVDPLLATLISTHKPPAFPASHPPFQSLARTILYQQLATKAANAIYTRFLSLCGGESNFAPQTVLSLSASKLREIGVSARKATYLHDLADKYVNGVITDESVLEMGDEKLLTTLTSVKGIGVWSVHMFMMFSLQRPDVLPVGDFGVRKGVQILYGLKEPPKAAEMEEVCDKWRPYRSVGSWYMWRLMEARGGGKQAVSKPRNAGEEETRN